MSTHRDRIHWRPPQPMDDQKEAQEPVCSRGRQIKPKTEKYMTRNTNKWNMTVLPRSQLSNRRQPARPPPPIWLGGQESTGPFFRVSSHMRRCTLINQCSNQFDCKHVATGSASCLSSVVRFTVRAFPGHNMVLHLWAFPAVVAEDRNQFVLIEFRHRRSCNLHIIFLPYLRHIANWLGAKRACVLIMVPHLV